MKAPHGLKFTKEHEWVRMEGDVARVGITHHAQDQLGDVAFVELPKVGQSFKQGDVFGVVESTKTTSDLFMPLSGTILEVHSALPQKAEKVNEDCYGEGWMITVQPSDPAELDGLLSASDYDDLLSALS